MEQKTHICPSCGGIIGRDCYNPQECEWITEQLLSDNSQAEFNNTQEPNNSNELPF